MPQKGLFYALAILIFAGCSQEKAISRQVSSYMKAKEEYALSIQNNSNGVYSSKRRLVPIPPFSESYSPGTQFIKSNFKLLTRDCEVRFLEERPVPDVPTISATAGWSFDLLTDFRQVVDESVYSLLSEAIQKHSSAFISFSDLTTKEMSLGDLVTAYDDACGNLLRKFSGEEVLTIDGVISGKEVISSTSAELVRDKVAVSAVGQFLVQHDEEQNYYLINRTPQPKFWIITEGVVGKRIGWGWPGGEIFYSCMGGDCRPPWYVTWFERWIEPLFKFERYVVIKQTNSGPSNETIAQLLGAINPQNHPQKGE